jgi:hypothetical protein
MLGLTSGWVKTPVLSVIDTVIATSGFTQSGQENNAGTNQAVYATAHAPRSSAFLF